MINEALFDWKMTESYLAVSTVIDDHIGYCLDHINFQAASDYITECHNHKLSLAFANCTSMKNYIRYLSQKHRV